MDDVMTPQHAREDEHRGWSVTLAIAQTALGLFIAGPAFWVIYETVTKLLRPMFGSAVWVVPVSTEVCFVFLFINGVYLALKNKPSGALRGIGMFVIVGGSTVLQVYAARHSLPGVLGHLVVVLAFYIVLFRGKQTIALLHGNKVRFDRLSAGECIVHPWRSAALLWWMTAWGEPSKSKALQRYNALLYARALCKADPRIGRRRFRWKRRLPDTLRYQISTGLFPAVVQAEIDAKQGAWQEALQVYVAGELALLDGFPQQSTEQDTREDNDEDNDEDTREDKEQDREQDREQDTRGGKEQDASSWPMAKTIDPAVLARRVDAVLDEWHRTHGEDDKLPAMHLRGKLRVRVNRTNAKSLLAVAYAARKTRATTAADRARATQH